MGLGTRLGQDRILHGTYKGVYREFAQLVEQWNQLVLKDAVLYRHHEDANGSSHLQLIVPKVSWDDVLHKVHNAPSGGHLGEAKTLSRLQERFFIGQGMLKLAEEASTTAKYASGIYPMQIIVVDIVGPFSPVKSGNNYVLVVSDYFTNWMEAFAIPNQEPVTVAEKLVEEVLCRFSIPEQLHSDQGRQFEGKLMQEVCKLLHINKTRTTAYHPQSDGFSPFFLLFGHQARLPVDLAYGIAPMEEMTTQEYVRNLRQTLEKAYSIVRNHTGAALERKYDRRVHGDEYQVGDLVWLHNPVISKGAKRKLHCPWTGPFKVVKKLSTVVYRIQDTRPNKRNLVVHFDRLKPCPSMRAEIPGQNYSPQEVEKQLSLLQEHRHVGTDLRIVDDDEKVLEIQPRDRGQMRKPGQQELPEPQAHEDGHEALESDVQNGELPQQEVPMLEEVAMQNEELAQPEVPSQE
ncbi:hypothetical protein EMCRGX_G009355 [Ephydatia muelleri]